MRSTRVSVEGRVLCIDKSSSTLRWVVDGAVQKTLDARFGGSATSTREGQFSVFLKDADHVSHLYGSSMPFSMFFSGGQAVHYSLGLRGGRLQRRLTRLRQHQGLRRRSPGSTTRSEVGDKVIVYWS